METRKFRKKIINVVILLIFVFVLAGCSGPNENPLSDWSALNFFEKFFVYPVGILLKTFSKLLGGYYALGILITTIIVRTIGWPIYAKTNDMSLKMQLMQPEMNKIQEKYADRNDPESQRMMQFEMAGLYRKYKIGLGGCLLPFLQFPIFMSIFYAIQMMPNTPAWTADLNSKFLGVDLFATASWKPEFFTVQNIGIIVLALLVTATQVLSQILMLKRQKRMQNKSQENIPEYRRAAQTQQQTQMQRTTQIMMYVLTGMMALFVLRSPAALGLYWLIGNTYSTIQAIINEKFSGRRLMQLKEKHRL